MARTQSLQEAGWKKKQGKAMGGGQGAVFKWKVVRRVWNYKAQRCGQGPQHQCNFLEVARTQRLQQESVGKGGGRETERRGKSRR